MPAIDVKERVAQIMGARVASVKVAIRDHGYFLGVGITTPSGRRTAIGEATGIVEADPDAWIDATCAKFAVWLDTEDRLTTL